jgi:hypothetical protein
MPYLLKLSEMYVATADSALVPRQRDALRLPDIVAALAHPDSGYLTVAQGYRLVKLRGRAPFVDPHADIADKLDAQDRFDEDEWCDAMDAREDSMYGWSDRTEPLDD